MSKLTVAEELVITRRLALSGEARRIREAAGLNLAEVGRSVGADASTVGRWERGERRPQGKAAVAYGRLLGRLATTVFEVA